MTYLDDPDFEWEVDPESGQRSLRELFDELADRSHVEANFNDSLQLIITGYRGLVEKNREASDEQCLETSMIWCYG